VGFCFKELIYLVKTFENSLLLWGHDPYQYGMSLQRFGDCMCLHHQEPRRHNFIQVKGWNFINLENGFCFPLVDDTVMTVCSRGWILVRHVYDLRTNDFVFEDFKTISYNFPFEVKKPHYCIFVSPDFTVVLPSCSERLDVR
jgi:hypothetical protein